MQRSIIAPAERVTNLRWGIALLVGFGVLVSALDQVSVAVSGGNLMRTFGLTDVGLGYLLSAYGWGYAIAMIPFGMLLDRFGVARTGQWWSLGWSVVALLTAFATSFGLLLTGRAAQGVARAAALPTSSKATGYWFPVNERSTGTAIFDAGAKLAMAIGIPLMAYVMITYSWRATFLASGVLGLIFFAAWTFLYRDPAEHTGLTYAEKQHLARGGAQDEGRNEGINAFAVPKVWGLVLGFFAYSFALFVLVTWLPSYLIRTSSLTVFTSATAAAIPWVVAAIADVLIGGMLVDALIKRGMDATNVRRGVLIIGMLLGLSIYGAAHAQTSGAAIACIAIALAGLGISGPVAWSLPSLIAPRGTVGTVTAMMGCAGALGAIAAPIAAGYIVNATTGFTNVFLMAAMVLAVGILSYVFLLGRIEAPETIDGGIVI